MRDDRGAGQGACINRMSDHCAGCSYKVKDKVGESACPFNLLYRHFLDRHRSRFKASPRMGQMYRVWDAMDTGHRKGVLAGAERVLAALDAGEVVWRGRPKHDRGHRDIIRPFQSASDARIAASSFGFMVKTECSEAISIGVTPRAAAKARCRSGGMIWSSVHRT